MGASLSFERNKWTEKETTLVPRYFRQLCWQDRTSSELWHQAPLIYPGFVNE